jgi:hypothetical protein
MNYAAAPMRADSLFPRRRLPEPRGCSTGAFAALVALLGCSLVACHRTQGCDPGQNCSCTGSSACFLGCSGDGCLQECDNMSEICGLVCNDSCGSHCTGVPNCTFSCGNGCDLGCDNIGTTCGFLCGDGCDAGCSNAPLCGISAGAMSSIHCANIGTECSVTCGDGCDVSCDHLPTCTVGAGAGSTIECSNIGTACNVTCAGPCHLTCTSYAGCNLTCPPNAPLTTCSSGVFACGAC